MFLPGPTWTYVFSLPRVLFDVFRRDLRSAPLSARPMIPEASTRIKESEGTGDLAHGHV